MNNFSFFISFQNNSPTTKSQGSAEDELCDGGANYAKIRPMRVEMYGMNYRQNLPRRDTSVGANCNSPQRPKLIPYIATDSGDNTKSKRRRAVLKKVES